MSNEVTTVQRQLWLDLLREGQGNTTSVFTTADLLLSEDFNRASTL